MINRLSEYFKEWEAKQRPMMVKTAFNCGGLSMIGVRNLDEALNQAVWDLSHGDCFAVEFYEFDECVVRLTPYH